MSATQKRRVLQVTAFLFLLALGILAWRLKASGLAVFQDQQGHGTEPLNILGSWFSRDALTVAFPWMVVFFLAFFDWREPWQLGHLDLVVLLGLWVAELLISAAEVTAGQTLAGVCLLYLLVRMTAVWLRGSATPTLFVRVSAKWILVGVYALTFLRVGLSLGTSYTLDVAAASVHGATLALQGHALYGAGLWSHSVFHGDTYGPLAYYLYVPFVAVFGSAHSSAATTVAALCFDAAVVVALLVLGRREYRERANVLAFAYLLYPFTAIPLMMRTNDTLVAACAVWALVLAARPVTRGVLLAAAACSKFVPVLLCLAFIRSDRRPVRYLSGLLVAAGLIMLPTLLDPGLSVFLQRTFVWQADRGSWFSIWGSMPHIIELTLRVLLGAGLLILALTPILRPRPFVTRDWAALGAALLIGAELLLGFWLYTYIVWFFPLLLVVLVGTRMSPDQHKSAQKLVVDGSG